MDPIGHPRAFTALLSVWAICLAVSPFGYSSHQEFSPTSQTTPEGQQKPIPQGTQSTPPLPTTQSRSTPGPDASRDYKWWKDAVAVKEIGLSDQQVARIDKLFDQREKDIEPFVKDLAEQRAKLQQMIEGRVVDIPTLQLQVSRLDSLAARVHETRVIMLYRMLLVMTADQYRKFEAYQKRTRGGYRGGGPLR